MEQLVSVVIPVYKPEKKTFELLKEMLKKQTIPIEIIEKWNNPEAVSMNKGIREAKGDIIVILAQDCIPSDEKYIEKLIAPLQDEQVSVVISDFMLPEKYWTQRPFLVRLFTISDLNIKIPYMNLSSCAYRKKDLIKAGLISEEVSAIDTEFAQRITKLGRIERGNAVVYHVHPHYNYKKMVKTFYAYAKYNGIALRKQGTSISGFLRRIVRGTPFLGFFSIYWFYPFKKYYLLPIHVLIAAFPEHVINVVGFWHGFLFAQETGERNKEALQEKKEL
jgi:glycosyltransferase involved in cell wall biosynthesis